MRRLKSQSAMEYLMTYGWAILIIGVVLAVLFQIGVFSGSNFSTGALPGSCQVQRSSAGTSLTGECLNREPEFVANFTNTKSPYVLTSSAGWPTGNTVQYSLFMWINTGSSAGSPFALGVFRYGVFGSYGVQIDNGISLEINSNGDICAYAYTDGAYPLICSPNPINNKQWHLVGVTYNGGGSLADATLYVNATAVATGSSGDTAPLVIPTVGEFGGNFDGDGTFTGYLSNIQLYNTSLAQSEVQALYMEGIGGAPIRPQNLTGWWPLNGDVNDYGGLGNNGAATSVTYSSAWMSKTNYAPP